MNPFLLFFFCLGLPLVAQNYYYSDPSGIKGSVARGRSSGEWVLNVRGKERILYNRGVENKRWQESQIVLRGKGATQEKYYYKGVLKTIMVVNSQGQILEERVYDSQGMFVVVRRFYYTSQGRLLRLNEADIDGSVLSSYDANYRYNGSIRSLVDREGKKRLDWRAADYQRQYLDNFYYQDRGDVSVYDYREGLLARRRVSQEDLIFEDSRFFYDSSGTLIRETINSPQKEERVDFFYDRQGRVLVQNDYLQGILVYSKLSTYEGLRLTAREEKTNGFTRLWRYSYEENLEDPVITDYFRNGDLIKRSEVVEGGIQDTFYRDGEVVGTYFIEEGLFYGGD